MARTLQLRWTDETIWKPVRELAADESDLDAIRAARLAQAEVDARYPHTFSAEFRVIDPAAWRRLDPASRRFSALDI